MSFSRNTQSRRSPFLRLMVGLLSFVLGVPSSDAEEKVNSTDGRIEEDCHFEGDPTRNALVDDQGFASDAGGFSFAKPMGTSSKWDFCSGCGVAIWAVDPGLDLEELKDAGFDEVALQSVEGIGAALLELSGIDVDQRAAQLKPELSGADLDAFKQELQELKDFATTIENDFNSLLEVISLAFTGDIDTLSAILGIKLDSAFQADFQNPNDPRRINSGVRVWGLDAIMSQMELEGVPENVRTEINDTLSNVPGLPGLFEMSADDDSPLDPTVFHGRDTDLTIKQRTFVIGGQDMMLVEYTVVNDTTRIFPLTQLAFISDFDIPPGSSDLASDFIEGDYIVATYDKDTYADPELHYWFGISPALNFAVDGRFKPVAANWLLDNQLSLTQSATSSETKRRKFFLFDEEYSLDQDDTEEGKKSEKMGAFSVMWPKPLMPGEIRKIAFCYGGAVDTSDAGAKAKMVTLHTACQAMYPFVNSACGDQILQFGETCDDGNTLSGDGCSAECVPEVCGDNEVTGGEECDDGNNEDNDGCSASCRTEYCGDGITQTNEECDDGNESNTDDCLNTCVTATCGDAIVKGAGVCSGEGCSDSQLCDRKEWCITGQITFGTQTVDNSSALDSLENKTVSFGLSFDVLGENKQFTGFGTITDYVTTGVVVRFAGHLDWATELEDLFQNRTFDQFRLLNRGSQVEFYFNLPGADRSGASGDFSLDGAILRSPVFDANGVAELSITLLEPAAAEVSYRQGRDVDTLTGTTLEGTAVAAGLAADAEQCDDGNTANTDECTNECKLPACGDGHIQASAGEECDGGANPPSWCTSSCKINAGNACGNMVLEDTMFGEECDDGNLEDDDGCSALCRQEVCGDGTVHPNRGEACDDGNLVDGDGCDANCIIEVCGDGITQPALGETCDDGANNADDGACRTDCVMASCGDGQVYAAMEACDDGNTVSGDGCSAQCAVEVCGDGELGLGEECDDGNDVRGDGCSPQCETEVCGDGVPGEGEACDDGNQANGDGCDKDCQLENLERCGNANTEPGEQCDDGNATDGDGCSATCQLEDPQRCGDATVDENEGCDDGNNVDGDGCSAFCVVERCGDRKIQPGEACDDGNTDSGDGCDVDCQLEPATCGNGVQELGEACDGGTDCGDDCTYVGAAPPLGETCGNGTLDPGEVCDDGGRIEGDGCDERCQLEGTVCGNGVQELGEACDDGNEVDGDGCTAQCATEAVCGNDKLETGESCDDGNTDSGDGCNARCKVELPPEMDPPTMEPDVDMVEVMEPMEMEGTSMEMDAMVMERRTHNGRTCCTQTRRQSEQPIGWWNLVLLSGLVVVTRRRLRRGR